VFTLCLSLPLPAQEPESLPKPVVVGVDANGDPLLGHARARLGSVRFRHGGPIDVVSYSSDGKSIITTGVYQPLRIWEARTGRERLAYGDANSFSDASNICVVSPDARLLATHDGKNTKLWDVATGKLLHTLDTALIGSLVFAPDGKQLATVTPVAANPGAVNVVHIWDIASGRVLRELERASSSGKGVFSAYSLNFSPDAAYAVAGGIDAGCNHAVRVWDVATGKALPPMQQPPDYCQVTEWIASWLTRKQPFVPSFMHVPLIAPDNRTIASCLNMDGRGTFVLRLWDRATGKHLRDHTLSDCSLLTFRRPAGRLRF
jgi:WD40 repeat protein